MKKKCWKKKELIDDPELIAIFLNKLHDSENLKEKIYECLKEKEKINTDYIKKLLKYLDIYKTESKKEEYGDDNIYFPLFDFYNNFFFIFWRNK